MKTKNYLARILLLAPRDNTSQELLENLKFLNYEVTFDHLTCGPVDLIIRDAHQPMPLKELTFDAPMLIICDPADAPADVGFTADRCLFCPFTAQELEHSIVCVLQKGTIELEPEAKPSADLVRVHVSDFLIGKDFNPEGFVKTESGELFRYPKKCAFTEEDISLFLQQGISSLYVLKSDYHTLVGLDEFYLYLSDPALKQRKMNFFASLGKLLQEEVVLESLNPMAFERAKISLEAALSVLVDNKEIFELLEIMLYRHPERLQKNLRVSLCSVLMAQQLSDSTQQTYFILTASGLFHDLGFIPKILNPQKSMETLKILEQLRAIPREVITVITEPRHPFASILGLSQIIEAQVAGIGQNLDQWLQRLRMLVRDFLSGIDSGLIAALGGVFQTDLKGSL